MSRPPPEMTDLGAEPLGEVLDFMRRIWALHHALQKRSKKMGRTLGVTGPQRVVLRIVGRYPKIGAGQLAGLLHLHPSTLTGILQRLESQRLVQRSSDTGDARRALFSLTRQGQALDRETEGTVESAVKKVMGQMTPQQTAAASRMLDRLVEELG